MPSRRAVVRSLVLFSGLGALGALFKLAHTLTTGRRAPEGSDDVKTFPLSFQWPVKEPFIFCAHHHDLYPRGHANFGPPTEALRGRDIGQDFDPANPYRMYHGREVPGFPVHPHRGFETITIVRKGYVDHADSLGAAGRYGEGDVQWMTAGTGVQHSEMFPLLKPDADNTLELFQIWLNLPRRSKMVPAHFTMFWSENIPRVKLDGDNVDVNVIAGTFQGTQALPPPPDSWAADPANEVNITLLKFAVGGRLRLPRAKAATNRTLYVFEGHSVSVNGERIGASTGVELASDRDVEIHAAEGPVELLWLEARPIGEPVVQHGPFVMNTREEIALTIQEYQRTEFGGWPWDRQDVVHGPTIERFAKFPDGRVERPGRV